MTEGPPGWFTSAIATVPEERMVSVEGTDIVYLTPARSCCSTTATPPRTCCPSVRTARCEPTGHHLGPHPLDEPGATDITADVNFTALEAVAVEAGWEAKIWRQDDCLATLGVRDRSATASSTWPAPATRWSA